MDHRPKCRTQTHNIELLKDNIGEKLGDLWLGDGISDTTPTQSMRESIELIT